MAKRNATCEYCDALHWIEERSQNSSKNKPKFTSCCANGKVSLPKQDPLQPYLKECLSDNDFMNKIRNYNAAFSFVSFNANDDPLLRKGSVYTYKIQGMIHHRLGPLTQSDDNYPKRFAQIYIVDGEQQENLRMNYSPDLNLITLKKLRLMLEDIQNPYVNVFKSAASLYKANPSIDLKISIITDRNIDRRIYNKPTGYIIIISIMFKLTLLTISSL